MAKYSVPLRHREQVWRGVLALTVLILIAYWLLSDGEIGSDLLLALMSGILGTAFFWQRSHAEHARFTKDLFEYFNDRYDRQNDELLKVLKSSDALIDEKDKIHVIDYFNLCAEEWVFYQLGYIYDPIWQSWKNGMRQYGENECIAKLWNIEHQTDSYYGFDFPISAKWKMNE